MLRPLLAAAAAALVLATPAKAATYDDDAYWAFADKMQQIADPHWNEKDGYFHLGGGGSEPMSNSMQLLTPAQRRVLIALCRPFKDSTYATPATNQQIADELVVSVDAVKSTLRALFEVFGVDALPQNQKRASLALQALRTGVITRRDL
jgi:DNA-binding NarL/FixJ family response regulator